MMFTQLELRLIGCLAAVIAIFGIGVYLEHRGAEKCQMDDARIAAIQVAAAKEQEAKDASRVKDAEDQYHDELEKNLGPVEPTVAPIRLCLSPSSPSMPPPSSHPSGPPSATSAPRPLPPVAGPDIAARLYGDAAEADRLAAQLRALQLACKGNPT